MGVTTTLGRVMVALEAATEMATHAGPGETDSELASAYQQGVDAVVDFMRSLLNVGDHSDVATADVLADARHYCLKQCVHSAVPIPGGHIRCKTCRLRKHTIDHFADAAEEAAREATE